MAESENNKSRERKIYQVTIYGSLVNIALVILKFIAGFLGQSAAMIADAVHSLSDLITDLIVIVFVRLSSKPQDKGHDYGHGKYETLATLLVGVALLAVGGGILKNGIDAIRIYLSGGALSSPGWIALIAALLSIVSKEILFRYTNRVGRKLESPAVIANAWHHRSDALSSIGTGIGIGGAILLGEQWRVLDPLAAVIVSLFILKVALYMVKPCIDELLEKSLPDEVEQAISEQVLSFPEVSELHHLRTRRIGSYYALEMHVRMDGNLSLHDAHAVTVLIEKKLRAMYGENTIINIHVEPNK
ncbi:MAG: cation diffusion facilitator family transporter [Phocaeicola sp.]|nr:cation diffusion facilitator family transporter [Phocaeicola sp.]